MLDLPENKCGEIYLFNKPTSFILLCWTCKERFGDLETFHDHYEKCHLKDDETDTWSNVFDIKEEIDSNIDSNEKLTSKEPQLSAINDSDFENYEEDELSEDLNESDIDFNVEESILENENFLENDFDFTTKNNAKKSEYCEHCEIEFKTFQKHDQSECAVIQKIIKDHNYNYEMLKYENIFLCKECPRYFDNQKKLTFHRRSHNNNGFCQICNQNFIYLDRHMKNTHPEEKFNKSDVQFKETENYSQIFKSNISKCRYCNKKFTRKYFLIKHEAAHANNHLKCHVCGKYFKKSDILKIHMRSHTGEKPYKCPQCPVSFAIKKNLSDHIIYKHTNDKPFKCNFKDCGKLFKTDHLRNLHEKIHSDTTEFQCEICGQDFNIKAKLKMHYKTKHMDYAERPHKCSFCEKKFMTTTRLKEHERSHTGEKPLKCDKCPSTFARRNGLKEHKKLHTGVKQHVCKICGKAFAQSSGFSNHMKYHP